MKLKHTKYEEVTVMCKGKPVVFTGGTATIKDNAMAKELLKNPNIKEIKEIEVKKEEQE